MYISDTGPPLGRWDKRFIDQASDIPTIISFHAFLQNSVQKLFQFVFLFFHSFTKIRIKIFEGPELFIPPIQRASTLY